MSAASRTLSIDLHGEPETAALARALGDRLRPGDTILLEGPIGAGKSVFARALIHGLQEVPEDVPSPTYTLVQTYETRRGPVWHADLYRVADSGEIEELGLTEAFETAICLIEWPDRLGDAAPPEALSLALEPDAQRDDLRRARLSWRGSRWSDILREAAA